MYWYDCANCDSNAKNDNQASNKYYSSTDKGAHSVSASWTTENGKHDHKCTVSGCTYTEGTANCSGGTATCQSKAKCSVCNKDYGNLGDHSFGSAWAYTTAQGHAHKCTITGCGAHDTVVAHTPNIPNATTTESQVCEVCSYTMAAALGHTHSTLMVDAYPVTCTEDGNK